MLKALIIRLISLAAAFSSLLLIVWTGKQLRSVFQLTDPTGVFGAVFNTAGFAANVFVIFLFAVLVWRSVKTRTFLAKVPVLFVLVFFLKVFEALNFIPCVVSSKASETCGAMSILISYVTSPLILMVAANFILRTEDLAVRRAGLILAGMLILAGAGAWLSVTPKKPDDCVLYPKLTDQALCQQRFALSRQDIYICSDIEFRPIRYDCMKRVAQLKRNPHLCGDIQTPADAKVLFYEVTADSFRDACYYQMAIDLHDRELCRKMKETDKMHECLDNAQTKPLGGK
jgi:hypothetical protein